MSQKRRVPTLVLKAVEETSGGVQVVREEYVAPQEAQEWALDDELNAFREALPGSLRDGAPDSMDCVHQGSAWPPKGPGPDSLISAELLAQVAVVQNQHRDGSPGDELRRTPMSLVPVMRHDLTGKGEAFSDVDLEVSRLVEERGRAEAARGRTSTSSFSALNAFDSYEAPSPAGVQEASSETLSAVPASDEATSPSQIQMLTPYTKRRIRGRTTRSIQSVPPKSGRASRLVVWAMGVVVGLGALGAVGWWFFG